MTGADRLAPMQKEPQTALPQSMQAWKQEWHADLREPCALDLSYYRTKSCQRKNGPGFHPGAGRPLVARGQSELETILRQLIPHVLELLIPRDGDRARIGFTLERARRVLHVGFHQLLDRRVDRHQRPGPLGKVVHEDVVAFLGILPEIKDLGHGRRVGLRAFPTEVRVNGETAGLGAVVTAQVEYGLVVADARGARRQLVLGEVEPALAL